MFLVSVKMTISFTLVKAEKVIESFSIFSSHLKTGKKIDS